MREHGFLPSSEPAKRKPSRLRCYDKAVPATPRKGRRLVLFCRGPWPGLEGAVLVRRSCFFLVHSMSYVDSSLLPDETVMYLAHPHWKIYGPGIGLTVVLPVMMVWALWIAKPGQRELAFCGAVLCAIPGLLLLTSTRFNAASTELAVTNKRVIAKFGVFQTRTVEINLAKVEAIHVNQSGWGQTLDFGTIIVVGTGGTHEAFVDIACPLEFRIALQYCVDLSRKG